MKKWVTFLFICFLANSFSQTNISPQFSEQNGMKDQQVKSNLLPVEILNLYPLRVGNKWIYIKTYAFNPYVEYSIDITEIVGDSIAPNGKYYFHIQDNVNSFLERIDSVDGKVYQYYENPLLNDDEFVVADLLGEVGDTLESFCVQYPNNESFIFITGIDSFYKWGLVKFRKSFQQEILPVTSFYIRKYSYTEDIGLDYHFLGWPISSSYILKELKGCVINGIIYGDTTTVGVEEEETPIATSFILEQNYPNPFNPSTKIKFTIPSRTEYYSVPQIVTLKVYDVLGNEITTLVNEEKPAGEYEVEFNPESSIKHPVSGIYFYQLKTGSFIQTKKMLMIK
jgi:hypothetical protein